jgi:hypothetical protein
VQSSTDSGGVRYRAVNPPRAVKINSLRRQPPCVSLFEGLETARFAVEVDLGDVD